MTYTLADKRVWVAGHTGLVGSAIVRRLEREPVGEIITATSTEVDLTRQRDTERFVEDARPDVALIAAARVGGIHANRTAQASFLLDNLLIAANTIEACRKIGIERFIMLGSSCIYPRDAEQPISEDALLTGPLEETNEGYAIAKIAGLELTKMYRRQFGMDAISLMPPNVYGPHDNFDLETSHVLPALLRKIHEGKVSAAPTVEIWGTGRPRREFLHADDLADAIVFLLQNYRGECHINVGAGQDISVRNLATLIGEVVGWNGQFRFKTSMPDGMARKVLDTSRMSALGWQPRISLREGIQATYQWYLRNADEKSPGDSLLGGRPTRPTIP